MTVIAIVHGKVDADGQLYVRCGDGFRLVTPSREPLVQTVDLEPCPCGKPDCDRDEWGELMLDAEPREENADVA